MSRFWRDLIAVLFVVGLVGVEVALHPVGAQQRIDLAELLEGLVDEETELGRELQIDFGRDAAANEPLVRLSASTTAGAPSPPSGIT